MESFVVPKTCDGQAAELLKNQFLALRDLGSKFTAVTNSAEVVGFEEDLLLVVFYHSPQGFESMDVQFFSDGTSRTRKNGGFEVVHNGWEPAVRSVIRHAHGVLRTIAMSYVRDFWEMRKVYLQLEKDGKK
ncbi:MAG: hypothetical protein WA001_03505 [Patescibacteria group bacterium]